MKKSEVLKKLTELGYDSSCVKRQYENDNTDYPTGNIAIVHFTEDGFVAEIEIERSQYSSQELYDEFEEEIVMDEYHLSMAGLKAE